MMSQEPTPERPRKRPKQAGEAKRPKRGHGEGSVRKRPSGKWHGQIMLGVRAVVDPITGRVVHQRDIRSVTRNTRAEVVAALAALRRQYDAGVLPEANRLTLADLLEKWLTSHVAARRSAGTARAYAAAVRRHLIPRVGDARLTQLSPMRLSAAVNDLALSGLSRNTVSRIYTTLSSALTWAVRMRLLDRHPLSGLERPRKGASVGRVLTAAELRAILEEAERLDAGRWWPVFALMASTGMTTGETVALTWGDISPDGVVGVGRAARHTPRQVPLPPLGREAVRRARALQLAQRVALGTDWPWLPDPESVWPVLTNADGRPVDTRRVQEAFARLADLARIDGRVRPHDLRHSWNQAAVAGGFDARVRAAHLGHTTAINQAVYTHPDLKQQLEMAEDVERRLLGDVG